MTMNAFASVRVRVCVPVTNVSVLQRTLLLFIMRYQHLIRILYNTLTHAYTHTHLYTNSQILLSGRT